MNFFTKLWFKIIPTYDRLELKFLNWTDADILLKQNSNKPDEEKWHLAKEENTNQIIGMVYLERKKRR